MMTDRKRMMLFTDVLLDEPHTEAGCSCGHTLEQGELFMAYPHTNGDYLFVCLTCHFWNVMAS